MKKLSKKKIALYSVLGLATIGGISSLGKDNSSTKTSQPPQQTASVTTQPTNVASEKVEQSQPVQKTEKKVEQSQPVQKTEKKVEQSQPVQKTEKKVEQSQPVQKTEKKVEQSQPAQKTEKKVEQSQPVEKKVEQTKKNNSAFREYMHAYERFMNKYVEFMLKYKNSNDPSILSEYAKLMQEYNYHLEKFAKYEYANDLSDADLAYYLEVQARVLNKLSKIQ